MIRYWLHSPEVRNLAGEVVKEPREVGPYITQILGEYLREVSDEEILAYIEKMHGTEPTRFKRD